MGQIRAISELFTMNRQGATGAKSDLSRTALFFVIVCFCVRRQSQSVDEKG